MRLNTLFAAVTLLACSAVAADNSKPVVFTFKNAKGKNIGTARITPGDNASKIHLNVKGLTPGTHAIHVHNVAKCDGPDFKSAGPHADAAGRKHGFDNPLGPHIGDMKNFEVKRNGASQAVVDSQLRLEDFADGSKSIVIHEKADDYKTDPAGDSGARIACGLVKK